MCLIKTYSKVCIGKNLSNFLFRMVWSRGMLYHHCSSTLH